MTTTLKTPRRVLGLDWGMKRMGVALGDCILDQATPLQTIKTKSGVPDWKILAKLLDEWHPDAFIVGIPKKMNGEDLYTTALAKQFCTLLKKQFQLPIYEVDEGLSTIEARQQLFDMGGYRKIQSSEVDSYAAKLLIEQWLFDHKINHRISEKNSV